MRINCPHCNRKFDIPIKTLCEWIEGNEKTRRVVQACLGRYYGKKRGPVDPAKMSRGSEGGKKAAAARWKGHVKKVKPGPADLGI